MKTRTINSILGLGCAVLVLSVAFQAQTASRLQNEVHQLRADTSNESHPAAQAASTDKATPDALTDQEVMKLMQLRNETAQLRKKQWELAPAAQEYKSLRSQLSTNANAGKGSLPPGFIRKKEAQFLGMSSPDATMQSFLYALGQRDTNTLFRVIDGPMLDSLQAGIRNDGIDKFWAQTDILPGVRVIKSTPISDTETAMTVEFAPGMEQQLTLIKTGQEWKITK